jgi:serine/threonine protein kinase
VHNDIKPENILVGLTDSSVVYLIDFGLSIKYKNEDGSHVAKEDLKKFSGNLKFASLNSCRGYNKSRRDDIQSIIFVMVYLMNDSTLPWSDLHKKFKGKQYEFKDLVKERLKVDYVKELFEFCPKSFKKFVKNILVLQFDEEPKYDFYISKL